jgi:hypothetical protein
VIGILVLMLRRSASLFVFTLLLGASSPAFADDVPPKKGEGKGKSRCSVEDPAEFELAGLAALALLISGASLLRRRA